MAERNRQRVRTAVFVLLLLLNGGIQYIDSLTEPFINTILSCLSLTLYLGLLLYWLYTVRMRLLPSRERIYIVASVLLLIALLLIQMCKFRMIPNNLLWSRYFWYGYYVPILLAPTLFLASCLRMIVKNHRVGVFELALLSVAVLLAVGILTNEWHHLAFMPNPPDGELWISAGDYSHGPLFYIAYIWIGLCFVSGFVLLTIAYRKADRMKKLLWPFLLLALWLALLGLCQFFSTRRYLRFFEFSEIHAFCMIGFYETCIRSRLMPCNDNYAGFFHAMQVPAVITDRSYTLFYQTAAPLSASREQMEAAIHAPVYPTPDIRLSGMAITAGYAFWTDDERELHRMNDQLMQANEAIEKENELIEAETRLKEQLALAGAQNRLYAGVSHRMYPAQKRLAALLESAVPNTPGFRNELARALVIDAFIKRGSNLLLMDAKDGMLPSRELELALQESARYLGYCGIVMQIAAFQNEPILRDNAITLYERFEQIAEASLVFRPKISVAFSAGQLRMTMPDVPIETGAFTAERSEGLLYLTVTAGGAA